MSGFIFVIPSSNCFWNFSIKFLLTFILAPAKIILRTYWRLVHSKKQIASQPNLISYFSYCFTYNNYRKPIHIPTNNSSFFSFLFFFLTTFLNMRDSRIINNNEDSCRSRKEVFLNMAEANNATSYGRRVTTKKEILCTCNKVRKGRKLHGIITCKSSTIYRLSCNCFQILWHDDAFDRMHFSRDIYIFLPFLSIDGTREFRTRDLSSALIIVQ